MEKHYCFAGVEVTVSIPDQWMYEEERTLVDFRVSQVKNPHCYYFEIVENLDAPQGELVVEFPDYLVYKGQDNQIRYIGTVKNGWDGAYIRVEHCGRNHFVQVKAGKYTTGISVKTVLNALNLEYLLVDSGSIILHASFIEWNGKAILFTAPSGTGKSTQAELWNKYRNAEIINGDRAAIRVIDGNLCAAGIPFAGSSEYCKNKTLLLAAVVYLEQAPENRIVRMNESEAFRKVWEGCTVNNWDAVNMLKTVDQVQHLVKHVPVYHLACTPDESAVHVLEQQLSEQNS